MSDKPTITTTIGWTVWVECGDHSPYETEHSTEADALEHVARVFVEMSDAEAANSVCIITEVREVRIPQEVSPK